MSAAPEPKESPSRALENVIQAVRDLDMDEVRDELAQQEKEAAQ